jgi:hypothetical protein
LQRYSIFSSFSGSFEDGSKVLGQATLEGGTATFRTSSLPVGSNVITEVYNGGTDFAPVSLIFDEVVKADGTSTTLVSSLNPATAGQSVTFTATVKALAPGSGTPTGTVTFKDGSTILGTVTLRNGKASLTTSKLPVGTDSIIAIYNKTTDFATSDSKTLSEVAKAASQPTTTAIDQAIEALPQDDETTDAMALDLIGAPLPASSLKARGSRIA